MQEEGHILFPCCDTEYRNLLRLAYKEENPKETLLALLKGYPITIQQIRYLIKHAWNSTHLQDTPIYGDIQKMMHSMDNTNSAFLQSMFIYFATSLSHAWIPEPPRAYRYLLPEDRSQFVFFHPDHGAISYVWLDVDLDAGTIRLVRHNGEFYCPIHVECMWRYTGGDAVKTSFLIDMDTGVTSILRDAVRLSAIRLSVRVHAQQYADAEASTGVLYDQNVGFAFLLSQQMELSQLYYNAPDGKLAPLIMCLHCAAASK